MKIQDWIERGYELILTFGPKVIAAILIWVVGGFIIKLIVKGASKAMQISQYEASLQKFLISLIRWTLTIILVVVALSTVGIATTSFVAIIGAAGLAIGLALQGSLANFAGGVLILILKPFKVGDFVKAQGIEGTVLEVTIFNTRILTFGNQEAILPNGKLSNETILNFTSQNIRRENLIFGIGYTDNIKEAKDILLNLVNEQDTVLKLEDKMPMVVVAELGESSVNLSLRYWAKNEDFFALRWLFLEEGKARLEAANISIPFPQRDLHHYNLDKFEAKN